MSLIICNNCGRTGHIDKECRQWPSNELRGPSDHTDYAGQGSRANIGRQGMSLDSREPGSDTSNAVSRRNGHLRETEVRHRRATRLFPGPGDIKLCIKLPRKTTRSKV